MSAKQVIGVTLKTDGEKQFKQNVSDCNRALKTMQSEMSLVKERTAGQANSLDALRQKHSVLEKTLDKYREKQSEIRKGLTESESTHNQLGKALDDHREKLADAEKELDRMKESTTASNEEIEKQEKYIESLKKELQQGEEAYRITGNRVEDWQKQLNTAEAQVIKATRAVDENNGLIREAEQASDGCAHSIDEFGKKTNTTTQRLTDMDTVMKRFVSLETMEKFFDKASEAAQKLGQSAYDAALELDEGYDAIITKTGAAGEALDGMKGIADNIFGSMPAEMADVGSAVGEVNTRFKLTGDALEDTSRIFLQFAQINGTDVSDSVDQTDRIMKIFGIDASDTADVLGLFTKVGQDTGMAMNTLMGTLDSNGATFQELGFGLEASATMLAEFEKNGVDTSGVLTALRKGVVNASKEGKSANTMLREASEAIKNAETDTEALQIATEYFGSKGAVVMAEGLRSGRISLDATSRSMKSYGDVVSRTFEETLDPWDQAQVAMNNLKVAGSNLAGNALNTLTPAIEKVTDIIKSANEWFNKQDESTQKLIGTVAGIGTAAAVAAPKILQIAETFKVLQAAQSVTTSATEAGTAAISANLAVLGPAALIIGGAAAAIGLTVYALDQQRQAYEDANRSAYDAIEAAEQVRETMEQTGEQLGTAFETAEESIANAAERAEMAGEMVSRLEELVSAEKKSDAEMIEAQGIVSQLNALYPGLNAQIDEQGNLLNTTTEEIRSFIDNALEMATIEAKQQALTETMKELTDAVSAKVEASYRAKQIDEELEAAEQAYADAVAQANAEIEASNNGFMAQSEYGYKMIAINEEHTQKINDLKTEQEALNESTEELNSKIQETTDKYNGMSEEYDAAVAAMQDGQPVLDETAEATEGVADAAGDAGESLENLAKTAEETYAELYQSAYDSLVGQTQLWQEYTLETEHSTEELQANLSEQTGFYQTWASDLETVWAYAVQTGDASTMAMVQALANMGEDGAGHVHDLAAAIADENYDIVNSFGNTVGDLQSAQADTASILAQIEGNVIETADGMVYTSEYTGEQIVSNITSAGANAESAWSTSMSGMESSTSTTMGNVQSETETGMSNAEGAITRAAGPMEGAATNVFAGVQAQANMAAGNMTGFGSTAMSNFESGMWSGSSSVQSAASYIAGTVSGAMDISGSAFGWGYNLGSNFANGVSASISLIAQAAASAASAAAAYLHHSTPEKGPLHDDDKWGGEMVENFAKSMSEKRSLLESASEEIAAAAAFETDPGVANMIEPTAGLSRERDGAVYPSNTQAGTEIRQLQALLEKWLPQLANMKIVTETGTIIGSLGSGMNMFMGREQAREARNYGY